MLWIVFYKFTCIPTAPRIIYPVAFVVQRFQIDFPPNPVNNKFGARFFIGLAFSFLYNLKSELFEKIIDLRIFCIELIECLLNRFVVLF